jgi:hypothetical protein
VAIAGKVQNNTNNNKIKRFIMPSICLSPSICLKAAAVANGY